MLLGTISAMKFIISWDQNPQVRDSMPKRDKADLKIENKKELNLANIHCLGMSYYVNFLEGLVSNEFHIK